MSFEINLYYPPGRNFYYGGEEVSGYLSVEGPLNDNRAIIKVTFTGYSEAILSLERENYPYEQTLFFNMPREVHRGPIKIANEETRSFPFKFVLPSQSEGNEGQPLPRRSKKRKEMYAQEPHPLPPSIAHVCDERPFPFSVHVLYTICAHVMRGQEGTSQRKFGAITVVPSPAQSQKSLETADVRHEIQSKVLTQFPGTADKRRSIINPFGRKPDPSSPKAVFSFKARTVTILTAGQGIPIDIVFNYDAQQSNLPTIPQFQLLALNYELQATTNTFHCGSFGAFDRRCHETITVFKCEMQFPQTSLADNQVLNVGYFDDAGVLQHIIFDRIVVPPFKTYNVSRSYEVVITLVFQCEEKQKTAEMKFPNVEVVFNEAYMHTTQFAPPEKDSSKKLTGAIAVAAAVASTALAIVGGG